MMNGKMDLTDNSGERLRADAIEVRLPPRPRYLAALRAISGVLAGSVSFNYDEIMEIRAAISEVFELVVKRAMERQEATPLDKVTFTFTVQADYIEIIIEPTVGSSSIMVSEAEEQESRAFLESLMNEVEFATGADGAPVIRMVKRKSA